MLEIKKYLIKLDILLRKNKEKEIEHYEKKRNQKTKNMKEIGINIFWMKKEKKREYGRNHCKNLYQ